MSVFAQNEEVPRCTLSLEVRIGRRLLSCYSQKCLYVFGTVCTSVKCMLM